MSMRWVEPKLFTPGKYHVTIYGRSTDTKPTEGIANGSAFIEVNTEKVFMFDEEAGEWIEWGAGGEN